MDALKNKIPVLPVLPRLPGVNDVENTNQSIAKYRSNMLATNRMIIKDFTFRTVLNTDPHAITKITDNFIQQCINYPFFFTGTKWKPYTDDNSKYSKYTYTTPVLIPNGMAFQITPVSMKGSMKMELLSKNPGIAFDVSYDGSNMQVPAVDLHTDGVPTHTAIHNLGGYTQYFVETRWDTVNNVYGIQLQEKLWFNKSCGISIINTTGGDVYVWVDLQLEVIDDAYDADLELS